MTDLFSDPDHLKRDQYRTPKNLMSRLALHERFVRGPSMQVQRLEKCKINPSETVIDFGAGNGLIWEEASRQNTFPRSLTLVDLSAGMLEAAKETLASLEVETKCHDLNFPLGSEKQYDLATAFHMLYHLEDPLRAMDHMLDCVRPGGRAIIHLNKPGHLREIIQLINAHEGRECLPESSFAPPPLPEEVRAHWKGNFKNVERHTLDSDLLVTEAKALIDYIMSIEILHSGRYEEAEALESLQGFVSERVGRACKDQGYFLVRGQTELLVFNGKL